MDRSGATSRYRRKLTGSRRDRTPHNVPSNRYRIPMDTLALRLAAADGSVDGALSSKSPHDWDLAASHALLLEAGGVLKQADGTALRYNRLSTRHEAVLAGHPYLVDRLAAILTP